MSALTTGVLDIRTFILICPGDIRFRRCNTAVVFHKFLEAIAIFKPSAKIQKHKLPRCCSSPNHKGGFCAITKPQSVFASGFIVVGSSGSNSKIRVFLLVSHFVKIWEGLPKALWSRVPFHLPHVCMCLSSSNIAAQADHTARHFTTWHNFFFSAPVTTERDWSNENRIDRKCPFCALNFAPIFAHKCFEMRRYTNPQRSGKSKRWKVEEKLRILRFLQENF